MSIPAVWVAVALLVLALSVFLCNEPWRRGGRKPEPGSLGRIVPLNARDPASLVMGPGQAWSVPPFEGVLKEIK